MTNPITPASLRGAVDLSSLAHPAGTRAGGPGAPLAAGTPSGEVSSPSLDAAGKQVSPAVVDITTEQFGDFVGQSTRYPVIIALWSSSQPASRAPVDLLVHATQQQHGKVMLGLVDIDASPEIAQAFQQLGQQAQMPPGTVTTVAFLQGQPMPLPPLQSADMADELMTQLTQMAVANGVSGRVPGDFDAAEEPSTDAAEDELSPLMQKAYDAIESGDYDAAISAYEQAIADDPKDEDARLGLGQVQLLKRTDGVDLQQARTKAADAPLDVEAQCMVADLDVLGGHVEDAFNRLIELVRATTGAERDAARQHLIGLFDVVGASDPRVKKARTALMSALY